MEKLRRKTYLEEGGEGEQESQSLLLNEESIQLGNLHPKKREDLSPSIRKSRDQTIECDIQPRETLHSISLKYNVHLAELKRVNNILQDSEFYALKRIKIPVKPSSFLTDLIPGVHSEDKRRENGWYVDHKESPVVFSSGVSSHVSSGYSSPCSETNTADTAASSRLLFHESKDKKKVKRFLKEMDRDLERIKEKQSDLAKEDGGEEEEEELIVTSPYMAATSSSSSSSTTTRRKAVTYDDDYGCSSRGLVCWCCLVSFVVAAVFLILVILMSTDHHASLFAEEAAAVNNSTADTGQKLKVLAETLHN